MEGNEFPFLLQIVNAAESLRPETSVVPENQLIFDDSITDLKMIQSDNEEFKTPEKIAIQVPFHSSPITQLQMQRRGRSSSEI